MLSYGGRDVDDEDDDAGVGLRVFYIDRRVAKITSSVGKGALSIYRCNVGNSELSIYR